MQEGKNEMDDTARASLANYIQDPTHSAVSCLGAIVELLKRSADPNTQSLGLIVNDSVEQYLAQIDRKN